MPPNLRQRVVCLHGSWSTSRAELHGDLMHAHLGAALDYLIIFAMFSSVSVAF